VNVKTSVLSLSAGKVWSEGGGAEDEGLKQILYSGRGHQTKHRQKDENIQDLLRRRGLRGRKLISSMSNNHLREHRLGVMKGKAESLTKDNTSLGVDERRLNRWRKNRPRKESFGRFRTNMSTKLAHNPSQWKHSTISERGRRKN